MGTGGIRGPAWALRSGEMLQRKEICLETLRAAQRESQGQCLVYLAGVGVAGTAGGVYLIDSQPCLPEAGDQEGTVDSGEITEVVP